MNDEDFLCFNDMLSELRRFLCKGAIILPISFMFFIIVNIIKVYIPTINFYLPSNFLLCLFSGATLLWNAIPIFPRSCCNGRGMEVLFHLLPLEAFLFLLFAQWHFYIAIFLLLVLIGVNFIFRHKLKQEEKQETYSKKRHRQYQKLQVRFGVISACVFFAIPSINSGIVHNMEMPTFVANADLDQELFPESDSDTIQDVFAANRDLFLCFQEEQWNTYTAEEKITILQRFANFEASRLGIPEVPLISKHLGLLTLGSYLLKENVIQLNVTMLLEQSPHECMRTLCHEMFHSAQIYLINNMDWDSEVIQSCYFDKLRSWKENTTHYEQGLEDFEAYEQQPLEASADAYAEEEMKVILAYIESLK